jgi:putative ABC transport system permease protein
MRTATLVRRNLTYFWRTNIAVVLGVATAVAVLAGALVVGDSVRASLRDLALNRLGRADTVVSAANFFRDELAADLARGQHFSVCPLIAFEGLVTHESSGRRASGVQVYGVDERFWSFHGVPAPELPAMSAALAEELGAKPGDVVLLRVEKPSAIPLESLHGRKEDAGRTLRFTARDALPASALGEFSLRPQQGPVEAIFVPLARLARDLGQPGKVNTILIAGEPAAAPIEKLLGEHSTLEDLGPTLRPLDARRGVALESAGAILSDTVARAALDTARKLGLESEPVFTYLANAIRVGTREIPYSLVTADDSFFPPARRSGILLNDWAAKDLGARPGDTVSLDYYVWKADGQLHTESAQFPLAGILPLTGAAADREFAPDYPGITETNSLRDWDPPFPIDLKRVRPRDEEYWKKYRTIPKAFLPLAEGQKLWGSRFGKLTSIRLHGRPTESEDAFRSQLRAALDPTAIGFSVFAARAQALEASKGATDFGEYFVYFSFFLMAAALLLAALFFRLSVEQRLREIGTLRAMGFPDATIRNVFLMEGAVLALGGCVVGMAGAAGYGALVMLGLRTSWSGAVGTKLLSLHVTPSALAMGSAAGFGVALLCIWWTLRGLRRSTPRGLIAGRRTESKAPAWLGLACAVIAVALLAATRWIGAVGSFFGGGTLLLAALLFAGRAWLGRRGGWTLHGIPTLGFRNAAWRPGRSILCTALIASATFLIVAVDAFRLDERPSTDPKSGTGGFELMAESLLSVIHDPNTRAGREALNLTDAALRDVRFTPFRERPGDDASCLNLYQPRNPRVIAPAGDFLSRDRFSFQEAFDGRNPWLLLESRLNDGAIPAIADANSMTYILHRKLGEDVVINRSDGRPVRLRLVAALADSIFQGELIVSEVNFLRLFPDQPGYRFFLIETPPATAAEVTGRLETALTDYGFDVTSTATRLAAYHRVENTYLSTFQTLGALGLLLGTVGLAAVLARNVLERRRELALLAAVGYRRSNLEAMILAENALVLVAGLAIGAVCALIAIVPAMASRGGHVAMLSMAQWMAAILATGLAAAWIATVLSMRRSLISELRAE